MNILLELVERLCRMQDPETGLWYQVVDKGDRPENWHDTSGSAMFVYTIQRAIDLGYIDAGKYAPVIKKGYKGIISKARINEGGWWTSTMPARAFAFRITTRRLSTIPGW